MTKVHVERITLDLRGVDARAGQAAARQLGPALARALARRAAPARSVGRIDAGLVTTGANPDAPALAAGIAERIASRMRRG